MHFEINILLRIFCTVSGEKKIEQKYIHVSCDYVEIPVYRVLILEFDFLFILAFA